MTWWEEFRTRHLFSPNAISVLRGVFALMLPAFLLNHNPALHVTAFLVFLFAAVTDYLDGVYARSYNLVSNSGKIIDPSMDKLLILVPLGAFAYMEIISIWWVVPVFIREIVITFLRIAWMFEGRAVGAEKLGKFKFAAQVLAVAAIFIFYLAIDFPILNRHIVVYRNLMMFFLMLAVFLTVISGLTFVYSQRKNFLGPEFAKFTSALGVGLIPYMPGTWGSLVGLIFAVSVNFNHWLYFGIFVALVIIGKLAVARIDLSVTKDPSFVVIDETCGMMLAFFMVPLHFYSLVVGFVLFRVFDVIKPYPIRKLESLPHYWGILCDDLGAGFYTWLILQLVFNS
ncbi:MAG: CDP-diacylglycerol--glycerol-3-phosphate 3-phosphatidyltransferase [Candidatus Omnitrophica bacterium]|nr:CDP-diacylglycerol--glycerol-3-phosphate 3-phosphatidyltransferase [Candidatus Omnitrophota bacterium]